jgi:hypothetical protein
MQGSSGLEQEAALRLAAALKTMTEMEELYLVRNGADTTFKLDAIP